MKFLEFKESKVKLNLENQTSGCRIQILLVIIGSVYLQHPGVIWTHWHVSKIFSQNHCLIVKSKQNFQTDLDELLNLFFIFFLNAQRSVHKEPAAISDIADSELELTHCM